MMVYETRVFLVGVFLTLLVCGTVFSIIGYQTERSIVEHGCAHYDTQTGKWQWNKEAG